MSEPKQQRVYTLKSRCARCGEVSQIEYVSGIENHECSQGHKWSKDPWSTTAAIMGIIAGDNHDA